MNILEESVSINVPICLASSRGQLHVYAWGSTVDEAEANKRKALEILRDKINEHLDN